MCVRVCVCHACEHRTLPLRSTCLGNLRNFALVELRAEAGWKQYYQCVVCALVVCTRRQQFSAAFYGCVCARARASVCASLARRIPQSLLDPSTAREGAREERGIPKRAPLLCVRVCCVCG